ncbi:MAG: undecaprenyl diphosphate synthase [Candidatus Saccharimonadales bacterium]|jgi:undecaprenyl diphosphate synthase
MSHPNPQSPIPNPAAPNHVGLILDGNRRWAKKHGKKTLEGHREGSEVFKTVSLGLFDRGVKYVSAYVFSTENWKRTEEEVSYLMGLVVRTVEKNLEDYNKFGIKVEILGSRDRLSKTVLRALERTEEKTKDNSRGVLALCFNYGGRQELVDATKQLIADGISGDDIDEQAITDRLYSPYIPDIDLLIRSSGEQRLSGFMLWRASYTELMFMQKLWPEVTMEDIDEVLQDYMNRNRRFGG